MKKIASKYVDPDSGAEMINIEIEVDELDEDQEYMVQQATAELVRYILRLKGIESEGCKGCSGC